MMEFMVRICTEDYDTIVEKTIQLTEKEVTEIDQTFGDKAEMLAEMVGFEWDEEKGEFPVTDFYSIYEEY